MRSLEAARTGRWWSAFDDAQGLVAGAVLFALALLLLRGAGVIVGGTAGAALVAHELTGLRLGLTLSAINLPFYALALRRLGLGFSARTAAGVGLLSVLVDVFAEAMPLGPVAPSVAAPVGGLLAGIGLLVLLRHRASLGGLTILALHWERARGWRVGATQLAGDLLIFGVALVVRPPEIVAWSVLATLVLNAVLWVNHRR